MTTEIAPQNRDTSTMNLSRQLRTVLLTALGLLLAVGLMPAQAQDIFVSNDTGSDATGDGSEGAPFATIGQAVTEASANDVIAVEADRYDEEAALLTIDKEVTIQVDQFGGQTASNELEVPNGIAIDPDSPDGTVSFTGGDGVTQPLINTGGSNLAVADAGDALDLAADGAEVIGTTLDVDGSVELGSQTLLLTDTDGFTVNLEDESGNIVSSSTGTIGSGTVEVDAGSGNIITLKPAGSDQEVPNVTVTSGELSVTANRAEVTGDLTLSGGTLNPGVEVEVAGNYSQSGGTSESGGSTFDVEGNFSLTGGTYNAPSAVELAGDFTRDGGAFNDGSSTLTFDGTEDATFSPGASLRIGSLNVNSGGTVTLASSMFLDGDLTVSSGTFALQSSVVRLDNNEIAQDITVDGTVTNSTGRVVLQNGVGAPGPNGDEGDNNNLRGTGTMGSLAIQGTTTLFMNDGSQENVSLSGTLTIRNGTLNLEDEANSPTGSNIDLTNTNTTPSIEIVNENGTITGSGTVTTAGSDVTYDLTYQFSSSGDYATGEETNPSGKLGDLTVDIGSSSSLGSFPTGSVAGVLTVASSSTLNLGGKLALVTDNEKGHSVEGTISGNTLAVEATGVEITGSATDSDAATLNSLQVGDGGSNAASATVSDIQDITGSVTVDDLGDLDLTVIDGSGSSNIAGTVQIGSADADAESGTLTLGSPVSITSGGLDINDQGTFNMSSNNIDILSGTFIAASDVTYQNAGVINVSSGGNIDTNGNASTDAGTAVPELQVSGGSTLQNDLSVSSLLDIDNALDDGTNTITLSGDAELNANITGSGTLQATGSSKIEAEDDVSVQAVTVDSDGTVQFATDDSENPRTFTVNGTFTHTKGAVEIGDNDILISNQTYDYTAGTYSMGNGTLILDDTDNSSNLVPLNTNGNTVSIPNLEVQLDGAASKDTDDGYSLQSSSDELEITGTLTLEGGILETSTNSGTVTIGDKATIVRDLGQLEEAPTFAGDVDVVYDNTSDSPISTDSELPGTVRDLTVSSAATGKIQLNDNVTVDRRLALNDGNDDSDNDIDDLDLNGNNLTIGADGTVEISDSDAIGDNASDGSFSYAGAATVEYDGDNSEQTINDDANITNPINEFPSGKTNLSLEIDNSNGFVIDANNRTVQDVTFADGTGAFDLDESGEDRTLTVEGDITQESNADFFENTSGGTDGEAEVLLAGSSQQTITLNGDGEVDTGSSNNFVVELDNSAGAKIESGNLVLEDDNSGTARETLALTSGNLETGDNFVQIDHEDTGIQGFSRGSGTVIGQVRKELPTSGTQPDRLDFPVGTSGSSVHRPLAITFNDPSEINATTAFMTVEHFPQSPGGSNNLPITTQDGSGESFDVARYPTFYWSITTSTTLSPSVSYDLEIDGRSFADFTDEDIERLRIIDRASGVNTNSWSLTGTGPNDYNNRQPALDRPIAVVRNNTGGLTDTGQLFTLGLEDNFSGGSISDISVNQGNSQTGPDLGSSNTDTGIFTGGTGEYSYSGTANGQELGVSSADTDVATASVNSDDELVVTGEGAGTTTLTITAGDGLNITAQTTVNVNVNGGVAFVDGGTLDNRTVFEVGGVNNDPFTFTFNAEDQDPGESLSDATDPYQLVNAPDNASIDPNTGELSFEPSFAQAQAGSPFTIEVQVTDNDGLSATTTADLTVEFDRVLGDVDGSGFEDGSGSNTDLSGIGSEDALAALEVSVGRTEFEIGGLSGQTVSDRNIRAADCAPVADPNDFSKGCGGNTPNQAVRGDVNSGDALAILKVNNATGTSPDLAASKTSSVASTDASGALKIQDPKVEGNTATLPVVLSDDAANVQAADLTLDLNSLDAKVQSVNDNLPDGWMTAQNVSNGELKIGMIGQRAPKSGRKVAEIKLDLSNGSLPDIKGQYRLNGSDVQDLEVQIAPSKFELKGNYPNPVSRSTTIEYQMSEKAPVTIEVYNTLGQKVATLVDETKEAGRYEVDLDAGSNGLSSGVYIYRLSAGDFTASKRMTVVR